MSLPGKLHEISFYGLISLIINLIRGATDLSSVFHSGFHPSGFSGIFECYMFWALVLFIPLVIIGAFYTKYADNGYGLFFKSDNLAVIAFAHIAEEILGLLLTPFWFLKDLFTQDLDDEWKIFDYVTYAIEIAFIILGFVFI